MSWDRSRLSLVLLAILLLNSFMSTACVLLSIYFFVLLIFAFDLHVILPTQILCLLLLLYCFVNLRCNTEAAAVDLESVRVQNLSIRTDRLD